MRPFRDLPLRRKLTFVTMVTTTVALALGCGAFVLIEQIVLRRDLARDLKASAEIIGYNSVSALSFNDPGSAQQTLTGLSTQPHVLAACLYDRNGVRFATYRRPDAPIAPFDERAPAPGEVWLPDTLELRRAINFAGEDNGLIVLRSDLSEIRERLTFSGAIFAAVMFGAGLVAFFVIGRLQRVISGPISELARVAGQVAAERNYALRATPHGNDEVGALIAGFNDMLAQIQTRDANLQQAHDQLEQRVADRTRELRSEIAERQRSEQAVRESHQRFEIVTHATADVIWDRDMATDTVWRNDNFQLLFGYGSAEIESTAAGWRSCIHPEDLPAVLAGLHATLANGSDRWSSEYRFRRRDGTFAHILDRGHIIRDSAGRPVRMLGAMQDVTALKQAKEEVMREKARLQLIFESVPVGICLDDNPRPGERHRLLNQAHLDICGLTREAAVVGAFSRITHPEDAARQEVLRQQLDAGLIRKFSLEKRYQRPDGKTVWVVYTLQRQRYEGGGWQDLSTVVDITDLKRAQEQSVRDQARFKFIFDAVPIGFTWMVVGDSATRTVNPAHARITGVAVEQSGELGRYREVTHPDDRARQDEQHRRLVAGEIDSYEVEKRYLHADGTVVWAALTVHFYRDPATGEIQEISSVVDLTERKRTEAALADSHRQLLDTSRQAGMAEVATGVLHNVGNVLNSVNVSATLLSDMVRQSKSDRVGKLADLFREQERDLAGFFAQDPRARQIPGFLASLSGHLATERENTLREVESLRKNIEHIKDIVAMQQNYAKVSGVAETIALADLVEDALRMNSAGLARHDVTLTRDYQVRPVVTVEKHKVLQILVNLMRNAKYACDESGAAHKQMIVRLAAADGRVRIAVIDNGVGIPAENLTRIFAHGFTTRRDGHGFGLHSGALAARELGGSLTAHSEGRGRGATFILELPDRPAGKAA